MTTLLTNRYDSPQLDESHSRLMFYCVRRLGALASISDDAFSFITNGLNNDFWETHRHWKRIDDDQFVNAALISFSIQSLGVSMRSNTVMLLEGLRNKDRKFLKRHDGDIVQSYFYLDMVKQHGGNKFVNEIYMTPRAFDYFLEWSETEEGMRIENEVRRIKWPYKFLSGN